MNEKVGSISRAKESLFSKRLRLFLAPFVRFTRVGRLVPVLSFLTPVLCGALSVLALAPFRMFVVLFVTLPWLVWHIDAAKTWKKAFCVGFLFGIGYFLAGLYWISISFTFEESFLRYFMPLAVGGLVVYLALYSACACALAKVFWRKGPSRVIVLAVLWSVGAWIRGHAVFGGFPWNLMGSAWGFSLLTAQVDAWIGPYGLTFLAIIAGATPAFFTPSPFRNIKDTSDNAPGETRDGAPGNMSDKARYLTTITMGTLIGFLMVGCCALSGWTRLHFAPPLTYEPRMRLRILQPNISESDLLNPEKYTSIYKKLRRLSFTNFRPERYRSNVIIWPESTMPSWVIDGRMPDALYAIIRTLPTNTTLVFGAERVESPVGQYGGIKSNKNESKFYNSLYAVRAITPRIGGAYRTWIYDKIHLVPFGEYMPLSKFLARMGWPHVQSFRGSFTPGKERRIFHIPTVPPFEPTICYEIVFAHRIINEQKPPAWIINITNDAWFGHSTGPYQHFLQVQFRAIEEGIPIVRAANTGISALINPYGVPEAMLPLYKTGFIDTHLPRPLAIRPLYAWCGDTIFFSLVGLVTMGFALQSFYVFKKRHRYNY